MTENPYEAPQAFDPNPRSTFAGIRHVALWCILGGMVLGGIIGVAVRYFMGG